jgi:hypothetical protein
MRAVMNSNATWAVFSSHLTIGCKSRYDQTALRKAAEQATDDPRYAKELVKECVEEPLKQVVLDMFYRDYRTLRGIAFAEKLKKKSWQYDDAKARRIFRRMLEISEENPDSTASIVMATRPEWDW